MTAPNGECRKVRGSCHFKPRHRQIRNSTAPHFAVLSHYALTPGILVLPYAICDS